MTGLMFSLVSLPFPKRRSSVPTHLHLPKITPIYSHNSFQNIFASVQSSPKRCTQPPKLSLSFSILLLFYHSSCAKKLLRGWRQAESSQGLSEYFIIQTMLESGANDHFSGADLSCWLDEGGRLHNTQVNSTTLSCSASLRELPTKTPLKQIKKLDAYPSG